MSTAVDVALSACMRESISPRRLLMELQGV